MKGKVLAYDPATGTGVITGDDGNRYKFSVSDNRSPAAPRAGDEVDYVADAESAKEIFVVAPAAPAAPPPGASIDMSKIAADPNVKNILAKPNVIWAGVVILGSLIAGYFSAIQLIGGGPMGMMGAGGFVYSLLFFIPFVAAGLIFLEFTNHALTPIARLVTGAFAAGGPIVLPLVGNMLLPRMMGEAMSLYAGIGGILTAGSIITIAGGALILLTHFGVIKKLG